MSMTASIDPQAEYAALVQRLAAGDEVDAVEVDAVVSAAGLTMLRLTQDVIAADDRPEPLAG